MPKKKNTRKVTADEPKKWGNRDYGYLPKKETPLERLRKWGGRD